MTRAQDLPWTEDEDEWRGQSGDYRVDPGHDGDWMPTREAFERLGGNDAPILAMLRDRRLEARSGAVMFGTVGDPDPAGRYHTTVRDTIVPDEFWQQCCEPEASRLDWIAGYFEGRSEFLNMAVEGVQLRRSQFDAAYPVAGQPAVERGGPSTVRPVSEREWAVWVAQYRREHAPLPDVGRVVWPAARAAFGKRITQERVRAAFGGGKPGPRQL